MLDASKSALVGGKMHIDDIEALVKETMNFECDDHGSSPFYEAQLPHSPGLLYWIQETRTSFRVHTLATDDLAQAMETAYDNDDFIREHHRNDVVIYGFETPYIELAEMIQDQVELKRFPKNEEYFYNLSDPGMSWWLRASSNSLDLYFKKSYFKEDDGLIKLGPLGDSQVAAHRMSRSQAMFQEIFPIAFFTCDDNKLQLKVSTSDHPAFTKLKRALIEGNLDLLNSLNLDKVDPSLGMFFTELVGTRRFWIDLEEKLDH